MKKSALIIFILVALPLLAAPSDYKQPDYKGKVFNEISIDDNGISLTDSLGNVIEVPLSEDGEGQRDDVGSGSSDHNLSDEFADCPQVYDDITKVGGSTVIDDDECVIGDVVVVGNVTVRGKVGGSVTATGRVRVESSAVIHGDVIGRDVQIDPGADVWGDVREADVGSLVERGWNIDRSSSWGLAMLVLILLQMGIVAFVSSIFRNGTDRVRQVFHDNIFKALLVGFLVLILLIPAFILLLITVIGIPVALLGLPLAMIGAGFLGLTGFCLFVSDLLSGDSNSREEGRLSRTITGFIIVQLPFIGLFLFEIVDISVLSIIFLIIAALVFFIVYTCSLGAVILTRFGTRGHNQRRPGTVRVSVKVDDGGAQAGMSAGH